MTDPYLFIVFMIVWFAIGIVAVPALQEFLWRITGIRPDDIECGYCCKRINHRASVCPYCRSDIRKR